MKIKSITTYALALAAASTAASAQIVTEKFSIHGLTTNVIASATATINATSNTFTLVVDNSILGAGGANGTITSLGFPVPFTDTELGANGSLVSLTTTWNLTNPGHSTPSNWNILEPYDLNAGGQHINLEIGTGVHASQANGGNPNLGIEFGEIVTFVFQLPDFDISDILGPGGFITGGDNDLVFRWQEIGIDGLPGSGSDIGFGPGTEVPPGVGETPVPEPSTYGLAGAAALFCVIGIRRFRARRA